LTKGGGSDAGGKNSQNGDCRGGKNWKKHKLEKKKGRSRHSIHLRQPYLQSGKTKKESDSAQPRKSWDDKKGKSRKIKLRTKNEK